MRGSDPIVSLKTGLQIMNKRALIGSVLQPPPAYSMASAMKTGMMRLVLSWYS
jgi:hypothetical protein